jgi:hypothetical protein
MTENVAFEQWMQRVDDVLSERAGIHVQDVAEADFAAEYKAGISPVDMAKKALKSDPLFDGFHPDVIREMFRGA